MGRRIDCLKRHPGLLILAAGCLFGIASVAHLVFGGAVTRFPVDLVVYRAGAEAVLHDDPLYELRMHGNLLFTYPVFAALLFVPLTAFPLVAAKAVLIVVSLMALVAICVCALVMVGLRPLDQAVPGGLALAALALFTEPVTRTFGLGQVNLILIALVLLDLAVLRNTRWHGALIGIAVGVKLTPVLFVLFLAVIGRVRAALTAIAVFAGTVLLGLLAQPEQAWAFWRRHMFDPNRVGGVSYVSNQSILGVTSRLLRDDYPPRALTLALGVVVVLVALWASRTLWRRGEELLAVSVVGVATLLASPISWAHHWVWFIPAVVALVATVRPDRLRAWKPGAWLTVAAACGWAAVFWIGPMWHTPVDPVRHRIHATPWQQFWAASYFIAGVCYLTWALLRLRRPPDRPAFIDGAKPAIDSGAGES